MGANERQIWLDYSDLTAKSSARAGKMLKVKSLRFSKPASASRNLADAMGAACRSTPMASQGARLDIALERGQQQQQSKSTRLLKRGGR